MSFPFNGPARREFLGLTVLCSSPIIVYNFIRHEFVCGAFFICREALRSSDCSEENEHAGKFETNPPKTGARVLGTITVKCGYASERSVMNVRRVVCVCVGRYTDRARCRDG